MTAYLQLLPEVLLLIGALVALFAELLPGADRTAALLGALLAIGAALVAAMGSVGGELFGGLLLFDASARFVRVAVAALTALWLLWFSGRAIPGERGREATSLALFSAIGGVLLAASADLITLYMALELSTMPAYVLMGYRRGDVRGLEGALKYFLLSLLTSLIMLYGLSFLYGLSGTTSFAGIASALPGAGTLGLVAAVLALVGIFAKLSAAPFHFWAPDAYAGAPAASVAFVSTVPKVAGAAVLVRLSTMMSGVSHLALVVAIVAAASMVLGNLAALTQSDTRRLMAYSGVAHTGYQLIGIAAGLSATGAGLAVAHAAVLLYALAYAVPSMAVMFVVAEEGDAIADLSRLADRRPWAAWGIVVWLLSLVGIPPLAGFFGKLYLFSSGLDADLAWLVVVAVVVSVVSAGYYFRIVRSAFFGTPAEETAADDASDADTAADTAVSGTAAASVALASSAALALAVVATVAIGLAAGPLLNALGLAVR